MKPSKQLSTVAPAPASNGVADRLIEARVLEKRVEILQRQVPAARVPEQQATDGGRQERSQHQQDADDDASQWQGGLEHAPGGLAARGLVTSALTNQAAAADLPIAAFTRGMTSSAINCIERLLSAGSAQSIPA